PASAAALIPPNRAKVPPYIDDTAAAKATPTLENGEQIVGATDPDQPAADYRPDRTTPLADDPRDPGTGRRDYFDLARRFRRLAGKEIVLQVSRNGATEAVHVPPAFHTAYGLRLGMGP